MNKKGFIARDFVVALILFSGVIALMTLAIASIADDYGNTDVINEDFADKFDRLEDNTGRVTEMFDSTSGKGGLSLIGTFDVLFNGAFSVISLVFSGVTSVGSQLLGFSEFFGIPAEVAGVFFTIILSIMTALVVFIVISSVSRREL